MTPTDAPKKHKSSDVRRIRHVKGSLYAKTSTAMVERFFLNLAEAFRAILAERPHNWPEILARVVAVYNVSPGSAFRNSSPSALHHGLRQSEVLPDIFGIIDGIKGSTDPFILHQQKLNHAAHQLLDSHTSLEKWFMNKDRLLGAKHQRHCFEIADLVIARRMTPSAKFRSSTPYMYGPALVYKHVSPTQLKLLWISSGQMSTRYYKHLMYYSIPATDDPEELRAFMNAPLVYGKNVQMIPEELRARIEESIFKNEWKPSYFQEIQDVLMNVQFEVEPFEETNFPDAFDESQNEILYENFLTASAGAGPLFDPSQYFTNKKVLPSFHISQEITDSSESSISGSDEEKELRFDPVVHSREIHEQANDSEGSDYNSGSDQFYSQSDSSSDEFLSMEEEE